MVIASSLRLCEYLIGMGSGIRKGVRGVIYPEATRTLYHEVIGITRLQGALFEYYGQRKLAFSDTVRVGRDD